MKRKILIAQIKAAGTYLLLILFLATSLKVYSQESGLTEKDIISNAQSLFDKKDYQAALTLYAQLVSVHPDDPQFNYKLGICTLFGDRKDKKRPIKYLNNAAQTIKDDPELYYFLGMAYHQNQEFANAMKFYNLYLAKLSTGAPERAIVLEKVNACLNGLNLADKNLISEIISSSKFQRDNFHRGYPAQEFNGSLVIKPEIFQTEKERKMGESSLVFLSESNNELYFSGYENIDANNRDIFKVSKDNYGEWSIPEKVDKAINTSCDEDFPVLTDNGTTLYFCSKGHNSLGGYDIFRAKLDPKTKTFSQPENLGPGINSPFDDILFIRTKDQKIAYFASDRDNLSGYINVFKVKLIDNPFGDNLLLAEISPNETPSQYGQPENSGANLNSTGLNANTGEQLKQNIVKEPVSEPSKKAISMVNDRTKSMALADSAYNVIANIKNLVRELTNKRDRANSISQRKADEAKSLEIRFNETIAMLAKAENEEQFLSDLAQAVKMKEEVYQLYQRSGQANKIAWNLGSQIKLKNLELIELKNLAGKIQSSSISATFEETLLLFSGYKNKVMATDTLVDYSEHLMSITNDNAIYDVPQSELAFADKLKNAYKNQSLLAEFNNSKPAFDESIPIVIVDKRTNTEENKTNNHPQENPVETFAMVEPVIFTDVNSIHNSTVDEVIEIKFNLDNNFNPLALVEQIHNQTALTGTISHPEIELEINHDVDKVLLAEIYPLVEPVFTNNITMNAEPNESILEVNFVNDAVEPKKLIEPVALKLIAQNQFINEEKIEIQFTSDQSEFAEASAIIEPVYGDELAVNYEPDEADLDVNFVSDAVNPEKMIEPVALKLTAQNQVINEEELEILFTSDQTELAKAAVIIEPVYGDELAVNYEPDEANLDINFVSDAVNPEKMIEPVALKLMAQNQFRNEEKLEIQFTSDQTELGETLAIIDPVYSDVLAVNDEFEEADLEINFVNDSVKPDMMIEPVTLNLTVQNQFINEEELEILFTSDQTELAETLAIIDPVYSDVLAVNDEFEEADLEINFVNDAVNPEKQIEPILLSKLAFAQVAENEIDITFKTDEKENMNTSDLIEVVEYAFNDTDKGSEEIEINFDSDKVEMEAYEVVEMVSYIESPDDFAGDELEISFVSDQFSDIPALIEPITYISEIGNLVNNMSENIEISYLNDAENITLTNDISNEIAMDAFNNAVASGSFSRGEVSRSGDVSSMNDLYYLREAVMQAEGIESSKSDMELLSKALNNPDDLSYEELLYAAGLTNNPKDKLTIYDLAFIHIDRDWRAFNNAAVTAINMDDLDKANCYLYQASLLSLGNGQIQNNMGILACRQNQIHKAEEYFIAATNLGYDAHYNLQVVNGLADDFNAGRTVFIRNDKNGENTDKIIVDIIDYGVTAE
jgi:Flp pilus assembly protein TadD